MITHNKKMERKAKKTNIKRETDKKNNSAKGTGPDQNKSVKENVTHHLNHEAAILIEKFIDFLSLNL